MTEGRFSLPTIDEATLFNDGLELKRPETPFLKRPGRGEGLADTDSLCLFDGTNVSAADLRQGELGNCWLISAMATVAEESPGTIRSLIKPLTLSESGRYEVSLYDAAQAQWCTFVIDDRLPVNKQSLLRNVQISAAGELWPALIEKVHSGLLIVISPIRREHPDGPRSLKR